MTSVTWIPIEAVDGITRLPFSARIAHYDPPPPDVLDGLEQLRGEDRFRFANQLRAWIEVDGGRVVGYGQSGSGWIGATTVRVGPFGVTVPAVPYPDLRPPPAVSPGSVTFVQTAGGRTGLPMPRLGSSGPHLAAPPAWTTLSLTLHADGTSEHALAGASAFPRHWVYDSGRRLVAKSGLIDFGHWAKTALHQDSPWGGHDAQALMVAAESALERELSAIVVGSAPQWQRLVAGDVLVRQGDHADAVFLLFDGLLDVDIDGVPAARVGPGAIVGEAAGLEVKRRSATLRAVTECRVARVPGTALDSTALARLAEARQPRVHAQPGPGRPSRDTGRAGT
ncbi:MAG TPA: cyclic nucleotide-binding domain-containing protein [Streptosporangiaceae bacterium]|nr:cyclic nucleotide-binding domain-containing protein [Streptosporangiaceae bacterium]